MKMLPRLLASMAFAGNLALAPALAAQTSVQQDFEAATKLWLEEKLEAADTAFAALEKRLLATPNSRSLAAVRLRRGDVLTRLGKVDEAAKQLELGLAAAPVNDTSLSEDRMLALLDLGAISDRRLELAKSRDYYAQAEKLAEDSFSKGRAFAGLIQATIFVDANAAVSEADRALAWFATQKELGRDAEGELLTLKGRALINAGRAADAYTLLKAANSRLGGLSLKVTQADVAVRGDLSLAAMLSGHQNQAKEYMAYTGAGRIENQFIPGNSMRTPTCGENGIGPNDVAVVELAVAEDGTVVKTTPIYASNGSSKAIAFARQVNNWSWDSKTVQKIRPFFRSAIRLEMRCTNAPNLKSAFELLFQDLETWAQRQGFGLGPLPDRLTPDDYRAAAVELVARERKFGRNAAALIPALARAAGDGRLSDEQQLELNARGLAIARAAGAPAAVIAIFGTRVAGNRAALEWQRQLEKGVSEKTVWALPDYSSVLGDPAVASDKRVAAAVRLIWARSMSRRTTAEVLKAFEGWDASGPSGDPIIDSARANLAALKGQKVSLLPPVGESGCPLSDVVGPMVRSGAKSEDYPDDAIIWGFEGWASVEHSVTPDGKTVGARTLIAHPPFVFGAGAEKMVRATAYLPPAVPLPGNCSMSRMTIQFRLAK